MQNIFGKIDKKVLIILGVILIAVLIAGYFIYQYSKDLETTEQNSDQEGIEITGEREVEQEPGQEEPIINLENLQIENELQSMLFVCVDKCGDSICQISDTECEDELNCICPENIENCPVDCQ